MTATCQSPSQQAVAASNDGCLTAASRALDRSVCALAMLRAADEDSGDGSTMRLVSSPDVGRLVFGALREVDAAVSELQSVVCGGASDD